MCHRLRTPLLHFLSVIAVFAAAHSAYSEDELSHAALFAPNTEYPYFENVSWPSDPPTDAFSLPAAQFLAEASLLVYVKDETFIADKLNNAGFSQTQFFSEEGTYAFLAIRDDALVVCFRGSETANRADYTTDAKVVQKPFREYGKAHSGFVEALDWVASDIEAAIEALPRSDSSRPVWVTGHSLGAAIATLYGVDQHKRVAAIYPIGSPRVGGIQFAKNTQDLVDVYRVINDNDIVPRIPTPPFYRHIGTPYFITSEGELIVDPPFAKKWESRRKGHADLIERLYNEHWRKGNFKAVPADYVVDHSPRLYAEGLRKAELQTP